MKDLKWPHVVLAIAVVGVLGFLAYQGKDGATVIAGMLALLGALGFVAYQQSEIKQQNAEIKSNTNGNISQLMAMVEQMRQDQVSSNERHSKDMKEMADKLAMMTPPSEVPPVSE